MTLKKRFEEVTLTFNELSNMLEDLRVSLTNLEILIEEQEPMYQYEDTWDKPQEIFITDESTPTERKYLVQYHKSATFDELQNAIKRVKENFK